MPIIKTIIAQMMKQNVDATNLYAVARNPTNLIKEDIFVNKQNMCIINFWKLGPQVLRKQKRKQTEQLLA